MIIAREKEVLDQSGRAIFDNHQCNITNIKYPSFRRSTALSVTVKVFNIFFKIVYLQDIGHPWSLDKPLEIRICDVRSSKTFICSRN